MNIRRLMHFFIFLPCVVFVMGLSFYGLLGNFMEVFYQCRIFQDFLMLFLLGLFLLVFTTYFTIPVAGIVAIKDLPVEIKSQECCTNINKKSWACLWVHPMIIITLIIVMTTNPFDDKVLNDSILRFFLALGLLTNLTQFWLNILLYHKCRHRSLADALKTQALMVLTIVVSIVIMALIFSRLE